MKASKRDTIFVIVAATALLAMVAVLIILTAVNFFEDKAFIEALFIALTVIFAAALAVSLFIYFNDYTLTKSLQIENEYILGTKTDFNNVFAFQKRAEKVARFRKKQAQHLIAFTCSNLIISQNINRNTELFTLNTHLISFLAELHKKVNAKSKDFVFGFSRGTFLMYTFKQNEITLQEIAELIVKEIYEFAAKECKHLWVQPFFGIAIVNKEQTMLQQIENALVARDYSERNFEVITFYQPSFRRGVSSSDIDEISEGLEKKEFVVYYQPKYDVVKKRFISCEALIRWKSEKHGFLTPTKFLGKAEAAGLIHEIDTFVLRKVCEDLNDLRRRGKRLLPVSVNFSLYEFYSSNFLNTILDVLDEYQIPTNLIEIEITEATSQANQFLSVSIIKKLKEKGMRVLMDDFGVGFSNVGNLKKIPFDAVKIDKSFVDDITGDVKAREIVKFLISLCKVNEMEVIAEGVDSKEQVDLLRKIKCDTIQGFFYSEPLSKTDYEKFLLNNPFEKKEDIA